MKYKLNGEFIEYFPSSIADQKKIEPVYETVSGWEGSVKGVRNWSDLPEAAKMYVNFIEEVTGVKVDIMTTSPERDDTILINNPFRG